MVRYIQASKDASFKGADGTLHCRSETILVRAEDVLRVHAPAAPGGSVSLAVRWQGGGADALPTLCHTSLSFEEVARQLGAC